MADINLNAATYEQIVELLSHLATNYSNLVGTFYDVFYNDNPENVTFQMFDDKGVLKDFTVKNLALSNEYRKTGNTAPTQNLDKGTLYQDLSSGDVYTKTTDTSDGWKKLVNSAFLDTFIMHGNGNPDGITLADLGTLYVDTVNVALYICVGEKSWAPISASFLEFANRNLDNITESGKDVIRSIITQQVGDKTETVDGSSTNGQFPTALAVYQAISEAANRKQDKNMTTVLSSISTDAQYPSAKCVYDAISQVNDEIGTVQADLGTVKGDMDTLKSQQFDVFGTDGINVDRQLVSTLVSVETSNPNLIVTDNYDGIENPRTVLGTETTTLVVDGTLDSTKYSGTESEAYYIRNGKLFNSSNKLVSGLVGWTDVTRCVSSVNNLVYYGICSGSLYRIGEEIVSLELGCNRVVGNYCISNDKELYYLDENNYEVVPNSGIGWIDISGYYSSCYAVGIKELNDGDNKGQLYILEGSTIVPVNDGGANWTSVKGCLSWSVLNVATGALGICNGNLYAIFQTSNGYTVKNIGEDYGSTWFQVSGGFSHSASRNMYSYAILTDEDDNGKGYLYRIRINASPVTLTFDLSQVGVISKCIKVSGQVTSDKNAYAITENGQLFLLISNSISQVGNLTGWTDIFNCSSFGDSLEDAFGICDNKMYKLDGTTATLLYDLKEDSEIVSPESYGISSISENVQNEDTITLTYETINGRVVTSDIYEKPYIVEQEFTSALIDGTSATYSYRKWSNNILEQWVVYPADSKDSLTIVLPETYASANWMVVTGQEGTTADTGGSENAIYLYDKTKSSVAVSKDPTPSRGFSLYCYGEGE